jgi:hypothetical protein
VLRSVLGGDSAFDSSAGGLSGSMFVLSGTSGSSVPGVSGGIRVQSKDTSVGETVCVQARQVNGETSQPLAGRCRFESGVGGTSAMKGAVSVTSGSTSGPDESRLVTMGSDVAASGRLNHSRLFVFGGSSEDQAGSFNWQVAGLGLWIPLTDDPRRFLSVRDGTGLLSSGSDGIGGILALTVLQPSNFDTVMPDSACTTEVEASLKALDA